MLSREGKQTDRGAVGAEFIGYNRRRREALLLQEFPHQPNCRPSVPAGLNQEIQDFALTVHGTPEIELPPSNYDDHLVQVPAFGRSWPPTLNPPRIGPTEFQDPSSNCLIRDVETTLGKQVLNVPIAQRETAIEPDGMLDDDRWKAVTTVGYLAHPETLKHRPCRSHAVNVTMPQSRFPQGKGRTPRHPRRRRQTAVPTALLARLEPHRAGLLQAQDPDAKGRRTNRRGHLATRRQAARPVHRPRMRQLHQQRRICFNLKQSRSNGHAVVPENLIRRKNLIRKFASVTSLPANRTRSADAHSRITSHGAEDSRCDFHKAQVGCQHR